MAGTADKILEHLLETRIGKPCDSTGSQSFVFYSNGILFKYVITWYTVIYDCDTV